MPRALDYTMIDNVITANPDKSANELRKMIGMPCSHTTMCRRMLELGVREKRADMFRPSLGDDERETMTDCLCPKCGISHKMKLFWSGHGKPRQFCAECKKDLDRSELYETVEMLDLGVVDDRFDRNIEAIRRSHNRQSIVQDHFYW